MVAKMDLYYTGKPTWWCWSLNSKIIPFNIIAVVSPWSLPWWLCSPDFSIVFVLSWGYLTLPHLKQVIWLLTDSLLWIYNVSIDILAHVKEVAKISQLCDTEKLELGPRTAGLLNCHPVILVTEKKMVEPSEFFRKKKKQTPKNLRPIVSSPLSGFRGMNTG